MNTLSPLSNAFFDAWSTLRAQAPMPARESVDPAAFGLLRPGMFVVRFLEPRRNFIEVFGPDLVRRAGRDYAGSSTFDGYPPDKLHIYEEFYRQITQRPCGVLFTAAMVAPGKPRWLTENLYLPLISRDGSTRYIAGHIAIAESPPGTDSWLGEGRKREVQTEKFIDLGAGLPERTFFAP
jgi:hypothetical protein